MYSLRELLQYKIGGNGIKVQTPEGEGTVLGVIDNGTEIIKVFSVKFEKRNFKKSEVVPVLRDVRDLISPIVFKGKEVVPMEELLERFSSRDLMSFVRYANDDKRDIDDYEFGIVRILIEMEFDVFKILRREFNGL